ncbi:hypothetical protein CEUSTIGMA_g9957.t1 [Chlamydomonas eustigma]|uniref:Uncharacterized protein n=1 Tax=Chlamydomonas eustigma TaxID=1157962 RepID=A0A250XIB6_9CHLO|nr:hypothetical protein CEUSTIGMA_g9957.t1 [Chlamydomonas eustigma]|eukprot:GAX82530.1 hypothetical protein CEUSTIGMA_g9957.t1 [Chlamydomonas eustigma]
MLTRCHSYMDGTLTVPVIDFAEMKRRAGVPLGIDILDTINSWSDAERKEKAFAAILEMEEEALLAMKLMPGAGELCNFLDSRHVPRGLITRNVKRGVDHFHQHHVTPLQLNHFTPAITRECSFAYKPSPEALLHICETWGIKPSECIMVGDSVKDDVVSGNRAGSLTVLLDYEGKGAFQDMVLSGELRPTHIVTSLVDVIELIQSQYDIQPAAHPRNLVLPPSDKYLR